MARRAWTILRLAGFAALAFLVVSCANPISSPPGAASKDSDTGSITITVANNIARTLVPGISMTAASYTLNGSGPNGTSFSNKLITNNQLTVTSLAPGAWTITANAWNAASGTGTNIGAGTANVTIRAGQASAALITVAPLTAPGALNLTLNWSGLAVSSVVATLVPTVEGSTIPLPFSVGPAAATYSSGSGAVPAGYYQLSLAMFDGPGGTGNQVMGAMDAVRIVSGQTTSGTYTFNPNTGTFMVVMTPTPNNPIVLGAITGIPTTTIYSDTIFSAKVVATDGTQNAVYKWYLNGLLQSAANQSAPTTTSSQYDVGALELSPGYYRLDVFAVNSDGSRAGSQTANFLVMPKPPTIYAIILGANGAQSAMDMVMVANAKGDPISNGTVLVNGKPLTYVSSENGPNAYMGSVPIAAGAAVTLTVVAGGGTYTSTGTMMTTFPTISQPTSGANWSVAANHTLTFTPGAPTAGYYYFAGITQGAIGSSWVYPEGNPVFVSMSGVTSPISVNIPADSLVSGTSYIATAGLLNGSMTFPQEGPPIFTGGITIANAASGSRMLVGGATGVLFNAVP